MRCRRDIAFSRSQFGSIRNMRQSAAAYFSAHFVTHQTHTNSTLMLSKQGIAHVYTRKSVLAKRRSANDDTSQTNCHSFCIGPRASSDRDPELTKRHETRDHSSWFGIVLSRIWLHSLRMSSVGACKHRGMLRWQGGRRRAAYSNVGHEGAQGALRIYRETYTPPAPV